MPRCGLMKRDALTLVHKAGFQLARGEMIMDFTQPSHILEGRHAHQVSRSASTICAEPALKKFRQS